MNTITPGKKRKIHHDIDNDHVTSAVTAKTSISMPRVDTPSKNTRGAKRRKVAHVHAKSNQIIGRYGAHASGDGKPPLYSHMNHVHDNTNHNSEVSVEVSPSSSSSSVSTSCFKHVPMTPIESHAVVTSNVGSGEILTRELQATTKHVEVVSSRSQASKNAATSTRDKIYMNMNENREKPPVAVINNAMETLPSIGEQEEETNMEPELDSVSRKNDDKASLECDGNERYDKPTSLQSSPRRKIFQILFKSFLCSIFAFVGTITYQAYSHTQYVSDLLQIELNESKMNLERTISEHASAMKKLTEISNQLGDVSTQKEECMSHLETITSKVITLQDEKEALIQKRSNLEQRLDSMLGEESDIQKALAKAYQAHDDLNRELENLDIVYQSSATSLSQAQNTISALREEGQECANRIVDLELNLVDLGDQLEENLTKIRLKEEQNQHLQHQVIEAQDSAALLHHQLVEEDGRSWYYELQIQHLEDIGETQENVISDLKYENQKLMDEIKHLKLTLDQQLEGGIAALNAVARSATRRKEEQFRHVEIGADRRVEQAKTEAVHAIYSVLSVSGSDRGRK